MTSLHTPKNMKPQPLATFGSASHDFHGDDSLGHNAHNALVVCDGVSGTKCASGVLARKLVTETLKALTELKKLAKVAPLKVADFRKAVEKATIKARKATIKVGRLDTTLSVMYLDEASRQIFVYTVGDCKSIVLRNGHQIVYESKSVVYDFNVPAVISTNAQINGMNNGLIDVVAYQPGDVCMVFSDGVSDNLYADEILKAVRPSLATTSREDHLNAMAKDIALQARATVNRKGVYIPFAASAVEACDAYAEFLIENNEHPLITKKFISQCRKLPSRTNRKFFGQEKLVKQINFYSMQHLLSFANKDSGKEDDISVLIARIN